MNAKYLGRLNRIALMLVMALGLASAYAEESGAERVVRKADGIAHKAVKGVKHGARKTGEALEHAHSKTAHAVDRVGRKVVSNPTPRRADQPVPLIQRNGEKMQDPVR